MIRKVAGAYRDTPTILWEGEMPVLTGVVSAVVVKENPVKVTGVYIDVTGPEPVQVVFVVTNDQLL